jgi:hypothetical protein
MHVIGSLIPEGAGLLRPVRHFLRRLSGGLWALRG